MEGTENTSDTVNLLVAALDPAGRPRKTKQLAVRLTLRPGAEATCEVLSRLEVPPGRYRLRVGATSAARNKSGSVFCDVDVPDFSKQPLSLSGVIVSAATDIKVGGADTLATSLVLTAALLHLAAAKVKAAIVLTNLHTFVEPERNPYTGLVLGADDPHLDVEVIALGWEFYRRLGYREQKLQRVFYRDV